MHLRRHSDASFAGEKELRPPPRRPTLLGSPMRTPLASPSVDPAPWPRGVNEVPAMALDDDETAALQAAIEASLGDDMKRRLRSSLQHTEQELWTEYPEETGADGARDIKRARLRTSSELEAVVSEQRAPSGRSSCRASPALGPLSPPPGLANEGEAGPVEMTLEVHEAQEVVEEGEKGPVSTPAVEEVKPPSLEFDGLLDHELLLESLYAAQGVDLRAQQDKATQILAEVGLRALDLGVKNWDEEGRELVNQCFYLSIARSYLGPAPEAEEVQKAALLMKRTVEACVLSSHPEWARDDQRLGENAMAFADFLPIAMAAKDPPNLVARLAVLILDSTQGHAEVYLGPLYAKDEEGEEREREELERNLVLLCYTPGHYKALVSDDALGSKPAWTYFELKDLLDQRGVMCIETCDFD